MQEVGCNSHILNAEADGRDVAQKILDVLSDEWMATIDVIHWAGCSENYGRGVLIDLLKSGTVEKLWDGNLGVGYWRKTQ